MQRLTAPMFYFNASILALCDARSLAQLGAEFSKP
jgi:hypothetical protein